MTEITQLIVRKQTVFVLVGDVFGRLTVTEVHEPVLRPGTKQYHRPVDCVCICGSKVTVSLYSLTSGNTTSCGCYVRQRASEKNKKHGGVKTPEYKIWVAIKRRCHSPGTANSKRYGKRGIKMCDEWRNDFNAFLAYVGKRPSPAHSIDRYPNNDGHYEPGNVRWATPKQQGRNKSNTKWVTYEGREMSLSECVELTGSKYSRIQNRLKRGYSLDEALSIPKFQKHKNGSAKD